MTPAELREAAELLLGPEWQRPLARELGPLHPDGPRETLDPRLIQRWATGDRPIPGWVAPTLGRLLAEAVDQVQARLNAMRRVSGALLGSEESQV